jgi:hypothetical protein
LLKFVYRCQYWLKFFYRTHSIGLNLFTDVSIG